MKNRKLPFLPTPFMAQSSAFRFCGLAVSTTMCCISRQVNEGLKPTKNKNKLIQQLEHFADKYPEQLKLLANIFQF